MTQQNRKFARPAMPALIALLLVVFMLSTSACSGSSLAAEMGLSRPHASTHLLAKMAPQESPSNNDQPAPGVSATQPSDGSTDVDPYTQILVVFGRPVVPLTSVDEQDNLPQPLTIEPNTPGQGKWVGTSVYTFQPQEPLLAATEYTVTIDQPSPADGSEVAEPVVFTFATAAPIVVDASPTGDQVRPDTAVTVGFSQPMDAESTAGAFSLTPLGEDGAAPVDGQIVWDEAQRTLTFTPTAALDFGASYTISVSDSALAAGSSGSLREPFATQFSVAPYPDIVSTTPYDGETGVSPDTTVSIMFNTTMSSTLLADQVTVSPMISTTTVYSYYSPYNNELILSWFKQPKTEYTVAIGGEAQDDYGNTLGEDRQFTFTTGDYSPFVNLELDWFTHFTAGDEARTGVLYRNVDQLDVHLYALPQDEALRLAAMNEWQIPQDYVAPNAGANTVWSRTYDTSGDTNVTIRQIITLTNQAGDPLSPGAYFMQVEAPGVLDTDGNALRNQAAILISDTNLVVKKSINGPSLAWLTDLISGEPVADTPITFYFDGGQVGSATTDGDGLATLKLDIPSDSAWLPVIAAAGETGKNTYGMASSGWNSGIAPWEFGLSSGWSTGPLVGNFYTDRPIYRPGDTVNWKGIIRVLEDGSYELPPSGLPITVTVRNDIGTTVSQVVVTPNELGTVNGSTTLSSEAGTGYYYLDAQLGPSATGANSTGVGFQVAEYRKPEFELSVQSEQPEYVHGDTIRIDVDATYFSGSPLADAPLTWRLIADPYTFAWTDEDGRWYSFSPYDPESDTYDPYRGIFSLGLVNEGSGVTAADGSYTIEVPADLSQSLSSQIWAFDVTVQSGTNQFVTGRVTVPVHRAEFYIGLSPSSYVVNAGDDASVDIVTLTPQAEVYPGAEMQFVVYDFNWNSVYEQAADGSFHWETSVERTPVYTDTVTTNHDGRAVLTWPATAAGQYQVVASATDGAGNPTTSAAFVWVSSGSDGEYVSWPMENNDRIDIVADKTKYAPGDVARILVPSPFQGTTTALVTEEQIGVLNAEVRKLSANSEMLEIPITEEHIPNLYVSVLLVKGVDETNPYPAMRIGYVMLPVDTSSVELALDATVSDSVVQPGDVVTYTIQVTDSEGNPQANAELSAAVVDKAVLSLSELGNTSLLDAFYSQRPLDVDTGASLVINQDRVSQQLSEGAKGGGGGGGGGLEVRSDFSDVAFWQADLVTDEDGMVTFSVQLPDSLTAWEMLARAVTDETKVGETTVDVVATKDLQIRPLTPRFLTDGDRPFLGAQLLNMSPMTMTGVMTYSVSGATLAGQDTQAFEFELVPGGQVAHTWPAQVTSTGDVTGTPNVVILASATAHDADGGSYADAVQLSVPLSRYESPETVATAGVVPPEGVTESILLPESASDRGSLDIRVEPGLAGGLLGGLDYLEHYPYDCNEQLVSVFLPNLVTVRALRSLDITNPTLESQLSYQLGVGVQRLVTRQNPDGGWGYWAGEESSPFITSYVLWGLSLATDLGYSVPEWVIQGAVTYLDGQFEAPDTTMPSWRLNEMAFVHYVLSEIGQGDPGRASTLYEVREDLGVYGKALLAMALDNMDETGGSDPRVQTLLDDIAGAVKLSATGAHWEEAEPDFQVLSTDLRSTAIALDALTRLRPDSPLLPQVVRWLMVTREVGHWSNTQENAWSIIALTDWMAETHELEADYDWSVTLNGDELGSGAAVPGEFNPATDLSVAIAELLRNEANQLAFSRTGDVGELYYTSALRYYLDASAIEAMDRGIVVDRSFQLADGAGGQTINSASVGDVISVTVTIVAPTDLHQLLVETPIPAGTEPIDPGLATSADQYYQPSLSPVGGDGEPQGWWRQWVPSHVEYRDDKVALFATYLPAGVYEYTFNVRATLPGEYRVLPAHGEMMYFTDVWGRSDSSLFSVTQ